MLRKMFTIGMLGIVALSGVPIMPAFAGEQSVGPAANEFQALSSLPDARRIELTVMTEEQLSGAEGAAFPCVVCINAVRIRQTIAAKIRQTIAAAIHQKSGATIRQTNVSNSSVNTHQSNSVSVVQRH
jgi:hypothetical protein